MSAGLSSFSSNTLSFSYKTDLAVLKTHFLGMLPFPEGCPDEREQSGRGGGGVRLGEMRKKIVPRAAASGAGDGEPAAAVEQRYQWVSLQDKERRGGPAQGSPVPGTGDGSGRGSARLAEGEHSTAQHSTAPDGCGSWAVRGGSAEAARTQRSAEGPRFGRALAAGAGMAACRQTGKRFAESGSNGSSLGSQVGRTDGFWSCPSLGVEWDVVEFNMFVQNRQGRRLPFPRGAVLLQVLPS